jgi:hypothetical protein
MLENRLYNTVNKISKIMIFTKSDKKMLKYQAQIWATLRRRDINRRELKKICTIEAHFMNILRGRRETQEGF